jgi:hypothetical protein
MLSESKRGGCGAVVFVAVPYPRLACWELRCPLGNNAPAGMASPLGRRFFIGLNVAKKLSARGRKTDSAIAFYGVPLTANGWFASAKASSTRFVSARIAGEGSCVGFSAGIGRAYPYSDLTVVPAPCMVGTGRG